MKEHSRDFERNKPSISLEEYLSKEPKVKRASEFAQKIHEGQKRDDQITPYYSHLEGTARIAVEELKIFDPDFVSACFLHDCIEDQGISASDIEKYFGREVADLVEGVTQIKFEINEKPVVKVFNRSFYEPKIGILKAACDRLHNMRTLGTARSDKRERKAQETLTYARLLESLGVWQKMTELEDLSFYQIDRSGYMSFKSLVENDLRLSPKEIGAMVSRLQKALEKGGVEAGVDYRLNGLYRLKKKMEQKTPTFEDVNDVITYTVVADSVSDCFQILNLLRQEFGVEEDLKRFDDFLSSPTENGYSALQMTIMTPNGAVELVITTKDKDDFNNWGVVSLLRNGHKEIKDYSLVLSFTPDGGVRFFKPGATGVDYAYSIDARLGARAVGLLVDGKRQEMSYVLKNGETVEVIRGEQRNPDAPKNWLKSGICQPKTRRIIEEQILEGTWFIKN